MVEFFELCGTVNSNRRTLELFKITMSGLTVNNSGDIQKQSLDQV